MKGDGKFDRLTHKIDLTNSTILFVCAALVWKMLSLLSESEDTDEETPAGM
jgi:hypothetical protein